ncbi:NAD(P)-dependent dehydrogenase (short-subunit alcohol dehydrogenase family) [Aeromonas sp. BIGb0405]|uniref:SDR family NAD(P)-dependent oxidoreductase n=1 Tax=Aeromonas sp. BIGb0405 TaxID=2940592 RepID=UPI00216864E2|nr:SDR family oxidoreductase [Aeromonas sp. BIGb0405]MCS3455401.1 NAD(P)-dependent dehydrogenase (short-subunit alcohol dehydrogenase family) [Aeromonas sp. BIGb0405]
MLQDKTILVTGASSGIGRAIAQYFSCQGARLVITGRNQQRLNETLVSLSGHTHTALTANLDSVEAIQLLMDSISDKVGVLDGIVHCAGIKKTLPLQALQEKDFDDCFSANVKSAQFIVKFLRKKGRFNPLGTSVVFLSSVAASCGEPANSTYAASKAALEGLAKSLAMELARINIRVNCLAPGMIKTEMLHDFSKHITEEQLSKLLQKHPLGFGEPEDVAHAAGFLSSDLSKWITGTTLFVDGGYSAH